MPTNKQLYNKRHNQPLNEPNSKIEISRKSKIPKKVLDQVWDAGAGAYKTNPTSVRMKGTYKKNVKAPMSKKLSQGRWAMARVYSFVNKIEDPKIKLNHDRHLLKQIPRLKGKDLSKI